MINLEARADKIKITNDELIVFLVDKGVSRMGYRKPTLAEVKKEAVRYLGFLKKDGAKIRAAYLFGSFAEGKQRMDSDVDLLISLSGFKTWIEAGGYLHKKLYEFKSRYHFDVIGHSRARLDPGVPLENEVLRKGIKLNK